MPKKIIAKFSVEHLQILDEKGNVDKKLMPKLTNDQIKQLYRFMALTRAFDIKAWNLQRQGRIGTYAPIIGQEASDVGSAFALGKEDWIFPTYRNMGAYITKGMPLHMLLQYWGGDERGQKIPDDMNIFTLSIPVGTQPLHAVGFAWAAKKKKAKFATIVYSGEAGTSTGDFNEAMNFAGVFKIPVVFIVENNQYAISLSRKRQSAAETFAQKAIAFGFEGIQVDGNDVFAVYKAVKDAVDKAKAGKGPTFIECFTYRMGHHTTADDSKRYRSNKELKEWEKRDPISRLRTYMEKNNLWSKKDEEALLEEVNEKVEKAVKDFEAVERAEPAEILDFMFKDLTQPLKEQKEYLEKIVEEQPQPEVKPAEEKEEFRFP